MLGPNTTDLLGNLTSSQQHKGKSSCLVQVMFGNRLMQQPLTFMAVSSDLACRIVPWCQYPRLPLGLAWVAVSCGESRIATSPPARPGCPTASGSATLGSQRHQRRLSAETRSSMLGSPASECCLIPEDSRSPLLRADQAGDRLFPAQLGQVRIPRASLPPFCALATHAVAWPSFGQLLR